MFSAILFSVEREKIKKTKQKPRNAAREEEGLIFLFVNV